MQTGWGAVFVFFFACNMGTDRNTATCTQVGEMVVSKLGMVSLSGDGLVTIWVFHRKAGCNVFLGYNWSAGRALGLFRVF